MAGVTVSIMIIVADHNVRVRLRKTAEEITDLKVLSVADPRDGLIQLPLVTPTPRLILLGDQLPLMTPAEFLAQKSQSATIANIPVVLLTTSTAVPAGVAETAKLPLTKAALEALLQKY